MLEVLIGLVIAVIAFGAGFAINSKPRPQPKIEVTIPEIKLPDIKIEMPEIIVKGTQSSTDPELLKRAEAFEVAMEKNRNLKKAEEMTEEYIDLNQTAQELMDDYLDGKPIKS